MQVDINLTEDLPRYKAIVTRTILPYYMGNKLCMRSAMGKPLNHVWVGSKIHTLSTSSIDKLNASDAIYPCGTKHDGYHLNPEGHDFKFWEIELLLGGP